MVRIRFGVDELVRTRVPPTGVADMVEAVFSIPLLARPTPVFAPWRERLVSRLDQRAVPPLLDLLPDYNPPLFMIMRTDDPARLADRIESVPTARLAVDLAAVGRPGPLGRGDRDVRRAVTAALARYHRAFAEDLPVVRRIVADDLAHRAAVLARGGVVGLLESLHPGVRWRSPVLELPGPDLEITLAGHDVWVVPSVFLRGRPRILVEPAACFIVYPARDPLRLTAPAPEGDPLADLLGRTRAAVLRELAVERTTGELADRLGVSPATASEHASVLRAAGFVTTRRDGRSVRHGQTELGRSAAGR
ncbi:helix-turn-helix domain-containing protein [Actinokineospora sp. NBRC 105648]|uniref:ArsR/SmtB family transcription factor n=1 Tax=Actinokineospora sp. NBRC 105648 TaxID=3032206 RepID=UPI0024A0AA2D|nr:helix-turn-helix domain-containing protein [Actinokineospora sp. NBRC 105648]GLZ37537.1 transcriptional regulator [Actinokineospora sp. NBRC 105648]